MTAAEARAYSDNLYPPSPADLAHEAKLRQELFARDADPQAKQVKQERKAPWSFIVDLVLGSVPMIDAAILHRGWTTFIVFWLVMAVLRYISRISSKKHWGFWRQAALKIPVVVVAELAVSVSAMENCNEALTSCHRVFF